MSLELAGWCKFTKFMSHHKFRYIHGDELILVMNCKSVSYEIRSDRCPSAPCLNNTFFCFSLLDSKHLFFKIGCYIRTFFNWTCHLFFLKFFSYWFRVAPETVLFRQLTGVLSLNYML